MSEKDNKKIIEQTVKAVIDPSWQDYEPGDQLLVTHPSWNDYKRGDIVEIDEADITNRIRSLTIPHKPANRRVHKVSSSEGSEGGEGSDGNKEPEPDPAPNQGRGQGSRKK